MEHTGISPGYIFQIKKPVKTKKRLSNKYVDSLFVFDLKTIISVYQRTTSWQHHLLQ